MTGGGGDIYEQKHSFPSLQRMFMTGGVDGGVGVHMSRRALKLILPNSKLIQPQYIKGVGVGIYASEESCVKS